MRFQLIKEPTPEYSAIEQVLHNRGIENIKEYLKTTAQVINDYNLLGRENLVKAAAAIKSTIELNGKAVIIVDCDCDGFTSSAILINYLYDWYPKWTENHLEWYMHEGKQHGLSDCIDIIIDSGYDLVICPDASSNDYEEHKRLKELNIPVIVIDHHEAERISEDAIIINNQLSEYPNKDMSGAGVVWQFCCFLDEVYKNNFANYYIDLVALGMDADMMSLKSLETKYLIREGLKLNNLHNPFISAIAEKNDFSLKGSSRGFLTPMGAAFYIAPFVNAIVRSGTQEEKEQVFKSMLKFTAFEIIPSNKRGHKPGEMEKLYEQAMRTVTNVKNRQTRAQDTGMALLEGLIESNNMMQHKVLLFLLEPGQIDRNIAGLVANKIMAKYQRPCCILTRVEETIETSMYNPDVEYEVWDPTLDIAHGGWRKEKGRYEEYSFTRISYQGSARGCDKVGITEFKDICEKTDVIMYAEGHQGAFGLGIEEQWIEEFLNKTDEILADMPDEPMYYVDYIYEGNQVEPQHILDIANYEEFWGKDIDEPMIAIKNLKVSRDMITLMSPDKKPTLKITLPNKVSLIKFGSSQEEYDKLCPDNDYTVVEVNIVGTCNKNEWNGWVTPQIFIEDYELSDKPNKYYF